MANTELLFVRRKQGNQIVEKALPVSSLGGIEESIGHGPAEAEEYARIVTLNGDFSLQQGLDEVQRLWSAEARTSLSGFNSEAKRLADGGLIGGIREL